MCYDAELSVANRRGAGRVIQTTPPRVKSWHIHLILELRYREACAVLSGMFQAIHNINTIYIRSVVFQHEEYFIPLDIPIGTGNWYLLLFVVLPSLFHKVVSLNAQRK